MEKEIRDMIKKEILNTFKKRVFESLVTTILSARLIRCTNELEDYDDYIALFANLGHVIFDIDRADTLTKVCAALESSDVQDDIKLPDLLIKVLEEIND